MHRYGFSLMELSIVLVIIGLLVGGIIAGKSLIRAGTVKSAVIHMQRYSAAIQTFRDQYNALPGDMTNATNYWGVAGGNGSGRDTACYSTVSTNTATCNGNGNGHVYLSDGVADLSAPEWYRGWQHLANAGLITGHFTGTAAGAPRMAMAGINIPAGPMDNSGFTYMSYYAPHNGDITWFAGDYTGIMLGSSSSVGVETSDPILAPGEASILDIKFDDGRPATGLIRMNKSLTCLTSDDPNTAEYILNSSAIQCNLFMAISDPNKRVR
jgi:prepilin-type N-terminal cleavage/methylation domain-containing protein